MKKRERCVGAFAGTSRTSAVRPDVVIAALSLALVVSSTAQAQRRNRGFGMELADQSGYYVHPDFRGNHAYDGRFTWARIKYRGYFKFGPEGPGWSHDYPRSDSHIMSIMREITSLRPFQREGGIIGGNVFAFDDPELFKYPIAYFSEPGGWTMSEKEAAGFRNYLLKGGAIIVDDFGGADEMYNFVQQLALAMPKAKVLPLPKTHPIFNSFFEIDVEKIPWRRGSAYRGIPEYYALYENNDPSKRVMMVINYNADLGEYWEFSDEGIAPVDESNEAYKLGVNYLVYLLTH
jgi:hypothetical protein